MSKVYTVSIFIDEGPDKEENKTCGSRFIPYIYDLMHEHKEILFLVPFGFTTSEAIMRTIRVVRKDKPQIKAHCRAIYSYGGTGAFELFSNKNPVFDSCAFLKEDEEILERQARIKRNQKMVDMSDLSLFYVTKRNGRVDNTLKYAKATNKEFIKMF